MGRIMPRASAAHKQEFFVLEWSGAPAAWQCLRLREPAGALELVRQPQQARLIEMPGEDLHPHRQARILDGSARDRDARDADETAGDGVDVGEIHLQRIRRFFTDAKRGCWRGGRYDDVHLLEGP